VSREEAAAGGEEVAHALQLRVAIGGREVARAEGLGEPEEGLAQHAPERGRRLAEAAMPLGHEAGLHHVRNAHLSIRPAALGVAAVGEEVALGVLQEVLEGASLPGRMLGEFRKEAGEAEEGAAADDLPVAAAIASLQLVQRAREAEEELHQRLVGRGGDLAGVEQGEVQREEDAGFHEGAELVVDQVQGLGGVVEAVAAA